jgi:hypothetical protein
VRIGQALNALLRLPAVGFDRRQGHDALLLRQAPFFTLHRLGRPLPQTLKARHPGPLIGPVCLE